ncbi:hypothetical protein AgCh_031838 [Apium graveolens]
MDRRTWMYKISRATYEYISGVKHFIECAEKHAKGDMIMCPCYDCYNFKKFPTVDTVRDHLFRRGFMDDYTRWIWHGEGIHSRTTETYTRNDESFGDGTPENKEDDVENDRVEEMIEDLEDFLNHQPKILESLVDGSKKLLYPGCNDQFTRLSTTLKLCKLKVKNGWSDKSFTEMLKLLADILPPNNELPISTYEAKKILCPMSMNVKKIHACINDCVLFRHEYEHLQTCPKCGASRYKREGNYSSSVHKKRPPAKVLRYLPVVERFKRLFANVTDAKLMRWHKEGRKSDGMLRHPGDSPQWRTIDGKFPEFGREVRNLRLGLCADGMNPYRTLSSQHSTWPVLLTIYNLPPWLCMKRKYIMLTLLIPGPKEPGNNIDIYLQPLIEDLKLLWDEGERVYDAFSQTDFTLRAMIFCTISDFPGYGNLSGYTIKGAKACPICEDATIDLRLNNCKKNVYMGHRTFLPLNHPYRKRKKSFDGTVETRVARLPLTGSEVLERVKDIDVVLGKLYKKPTPNSIWKKKSIFWDLPYWEHLQVRHCLDFMHIEKNVCESLVGTLLNIPGKSKDGMKARLDMQEMGIRVELAPQQSGKRAYLPPACYTLSRKEKISFCECLSSVKVPSGYSSNPKNIVSMKDLKLVGMKSHDCHVLMQHLLPVAIRGILPKHVRLVITKLCFFFNAICSKVIDPMTLDTVQADIIVTLCEFEMSFLHSFFDIMVHLVVHLVREIKICGPLYLRQMYPFERFLCILKAYVRNRRLPEGSIVEGYSVEETIEFCTDYLASTDPVGIPRSRHEGRLEGQGTLGHKMICPSGEMLNRAHLFVLQHMTEVHPFLQQHIVEIRQMHPSKSGKWVTNEHNRSFVKWFKDRVMSQYSESHTTVSSTLKWLAYGPDMPVRSYQGFDVNGYTFYTQCHDNKSTVQNSGVSVEASSTEFDRDNSITSRDIKKSYYGVIDEIWEFDYTDFKVALFRCKWFDVKRGIRVDESGFSLVDFNRFGHEDDPFIFATQVKQVFYIKDPADSRWSIVLESKRRILGIDNVEDEDEYDQFDENPPFSIGLEHGELQRQVSDGSWTPQGHDDILSRALGRKEHGGRVRGVGGGAKIKEVFGSGKSKQSGVLSVDELATITQEITKKVQKECDEKMNEMMNLKLQGIFNHLKQVGLSIPEDNVFNDFGIPKNETVRSSCQSVNRQDHISNIKTPTLCHLWVIHVEKGRVVVARGTVFPSISPGENRIHNNPIVPNNVRVSVDDVVPEFQLIPLPVPCNELETIGNAAGSFVQWPKDLVTLGQDPISMDKEKGHDISPKKVLMMPKKVESKGSVTPVKKSPDDDTNSTEHCRSLRFLLKKLSTNKKGSLFKYEENGEDPIYVAHEDVDQFLKMSWLNIPILEIFLKYIGKLCNELNNDKFGFMLPSRLAIPHIRDYQRIQDAADDHWMLLLFCLHESVIYVFDSLKKERKIRLTTPARTAFKLYVPGGGKRNNKKEFLWIHTEVECPQQEGGTECGFFVMKYMHDIVMLCQKDLNTNWKVVPDFAEILECWTSQAK